ncbi:type II secretion system protein GspL [Cupriavidus basilensis]|uniref:General secretion pathway protein L n=1 Tax=Cupriavidus basilensis TaxID=68895 RepID=A0A643G311_9BURK|nr:type II secretion system protein GspL [Cupriavidus basilensis]QOT81992.1 hypothetical protein F7R26_039035 [Cupriavidus basilensis]
MSETVATCYVRLPACPAPPSTAHRAASLFDPLHDALAYAIADADGHLLRTGHAISAELPLARETVLLADSRDMLVLRVPLPAVAGTLLRETLPGLVEEHLIRDAEHCHIAVLARHADGQATLAIADRQWFSLLLGAFGQRRLRLLPAVLCLPPGDRGCGTVVLEPAPAAQPTGGLPEPDSDFRVATAPDANTGAGVADTPWLLTVRLSGDATYGIALPPAEALAWICGPLAGSTLYADKALHQHLPDDRPAQAAEWTLWIAGARALPQMDACQFELTANHRRGAAASASNAWPLGLALAAILLCLAGVNAQWWSLQRQQDALTETMNSVLREHFPKTGPIVDALAQMQQQLNSLREAKGQPAAGDFAILADRFATALGPVPVTAVSEIGYHEGSLRVRLISSGSNAKIDTDGLRSRLEKAGVSARLEDGQWILRSRT